MSALRFLWRPLPAASFSLALAWVAAEICLHLRAPLPWMIGPLLAVSIVSLLGGPVRSVAPVRDAGLGVIGIALGLYFTPQVTMLIASLWWAIVLAVVWALALGGAFAWWLHLRHAGLIGGSAQQVRATCYFAAAIGGASEMTALAEREEARTDLVAASHSLRMLLVTIVVPFAMALAGSKGSEVATLGARGVNTEGLLIFALAAVMGGWLLKRTGRGNPWVLGPLLASMTLTLCGMELSSIPVELTNAAQLAIGISLGVRFRSGFLQTAPRWLVTVAIGTLVMISMSAVFAALVAKLANLAPSTLVLGTAPGGIAEMSITAKALQLGVPMVTAFQVCRLLAVLMLVGPLYPWWSAKVSRDD